MLKLLASSLGQLQALRCRKNHSAPICKNDYVTGL